MLTTHFTPGSPIWLDLASADTAASAAFYRAVFGWTFESLGDEAGGYGVFTLDGRIVAAQGPVAGPDDRPSWTLYFHTADAGAIATAVEAAGGTSLFPPADVFTAGRMGHFTDPVGARFAVWQPRDTKGLEAVNEVGALCWAELVAVDVPAAEAFYDAVFAWRYTPLPVPDMQYTSFAPAGQGDDGDCGGLVAPHPGVPGSEVPRQWYPYFEVADCDATVDRAVDHGATVFAPPEDMPGAGRMATLADPSGALFKVIKSEPPTGS